VRTDQALGDASARLAAAGVESPRWNAEQLRAHSVGAARAGLLAVRELSAEQADAFRELIERRAARVPLQHLVGTVGFRYVDVHVGSGVFIPRPETEVVAGLAVDRARESAAAPVVVDLCSGSGVIALSVAHEVPTATVHAVERDADALAWLRRNADTRAGLGDRPVLVHEADVRVAVPELAGAVDVVVANPPYVAAGELIDVDPEVRDHDPRVALVAGEDGLAVIHAVVIAAERLLRPGGQLVVEHSDRQGESVPALLRARAGWTDIRDHADLVGRPRCATATWQGALS
jgi:release factor glutamine methyltransferase